MGSMRTYVIGFIVSLGLTLTSFAVVWQYTKDHHGAFPLGLVIAMIISFAVVQLIVQLVFFLHLGKGSRSRWNLIVFSFALMVVVMVVFGSLWIMQNLNYHHPAPATEDYIMHDEGIRR